MLSGELRKQNLGGERASQHYAKTGRGRRGGARTKLQPRRGANTSHIYAHNRSTQGTSTWPNAPLSAGGCPGDIGMKAAAVTGQDSTSDPAAENGLRLNLDRKVCSACLEARNPSPAACSAASKPAPIEDVGGTLVMLPAPPPAPFSSPSSPSHARTLFFFFLSVFFPRSFFGRERVTVSEHKKAAGFK